MRKKNSAGLHHTEVRIGGATTKWVVAVTARIAPRINQSTARVTVATLIVFRTSIVMMCVTAECLSLFFVVNHVYVTTLIVVLDHQPHG